MFVLFLRSNVLYCHEFNKYLYLYYHKKYYFGPRGSAVKSYCLISWLGVSYGALLIWLRRYRQLDAIHTDKYFRNRVKSNQISIVITLFGLIWLQAFSIDLWILNQSTTGTIHSKFGVI